jgi:hypothetical protein
LNNFTPSIIFPFPLSLFSSFKQCLVNFIVNLERKKGEMKERRDGMRVGCRLQMSSCLGCIPALALVGYIIWESYFILFGIQFPHL